VLQVTPPPYQTRDEHLQYFCISPDPQTTPRFNWVASVSPHVILAMQVANTDGALTLLGSPNLCPHLPDALCYAY
jgi:hypothetical protein